VGWSGGYLALALSGEPQVTDSGARAGGGPLSAWVSEDGRTWIRTAETFDPTTFAFGAAPVAGGVVVVTQSEDLTTTAWRSEDGETWASRPAPVLHLTGGMYPWPPSEIMDSEVAGGPGGVVAIAGGITIASTGDTNTVAFSADGLAWETATLPGAGVLVSGVAAMQSGFVAVGSSGGDPENPVAWWSADGLHWTQTLDATAKPGEVFEFVQAGIGALLANSWSGLSGPAAWWSSPDGRSWSLATELHGGATGDGGWFEGDGTRLLWYTVPDALPTEYWTSLDAATWTKLTLTGDTSAATAGHATPFLMRDGVLFMGDVAGATWFGSVAR
jgi:hypothetical protein